MSPALEVFFQFLIPYLLMILDRKSRGGMSGLEFHSIAGMSLSNVKNVGKDLWHKGNNEGIQEERISIMFIKG